MGPGTSDHHPEYPTRFQGSGLPVSQFELRAIWEGAEDLVPGVCQLIEFPYEETDEVVSERLRDLSTKDARARYVVEQGDRSTTSLTYREAMEFGRRLEAGEPPADLTRDLVPLLALGSFFAFALKSSSSPARTVRLWSCRWTISSPSLISSSFMLAQ